MTGVEADARMAEVARLRGTPVEVAKFEDWDPAGRTFDRVTAAQVWHWVDPVAGAALARVLDGIGAVIDRFGGAFEMEYSTLLLESARDQPTG